MHRIQYKIIKVFPVIMFIIINIIFIVLVSILGYYYFTNNQQDNKQNSNKPSPTPTPNENVIIDNDLADELLRGNGTQTSVPEPTSTISQTPQQTLSPTVNPTVTVTNSTITNTPKRQTQPPTHTTTSPPTTTQRATNTTTITNTPSNPFNSSDFVSLYDYYTGIEINRIKYWKEDYEGQVDLPSFYKRFIDENKKIISEYELLPYVNNSVPPQTQLLSQYTISNRQAKQYISQDEYVVVEIRFYPNEFTNSTTTRLKFYYIDDNKNTVRKFANEQEKQYLIQLSSAISNSIKYPNITNITLNNKYKFLLPIYKHFSINGNNSRILVYDKDNMAIPRLTIKTYLDEFITSCFELNEVQGVNYSEVNYEIKVKEAKIKDTQNCTGPTKSIIVYEIQNQLFITLMSSDNSYNYLNAMRNGDTFIVDYVINSLKIL